ncbi:hypothetical protein PPL_04412 [Heterostelium album PN500]|uniref:Transmembrane protein n=1 Tax=Heterostelium pallidum (strain ATCC 26659 / Pp 5 / PN500) TaxID=670386 RepID=D3B7H4_HETP5|nr:hypothetical protein PPL_04412 [Heterostelium album PN500]EFA82717.1 hypothetical protein PPL_04412 [Heterostelium album PN500]|eukprot:XP_020434834.1 hypothetical protein PPL_04412 [Heterostelium album PN500]
MSTENDLEAYPNDPEIDLDNNSVTFSAKDYHHASLSPSLATVNSGATTGDNQQHHQTLQFQHPYQPTNSNNSRSINSTTIADNNESLHSCLQNSNISSSNQTPYAEFSTKASTDEFVHMTGNPPSMLALFGRIFMSWLFGLVNMIILMLFNPQFPMHFIWGVLSVGCLMTAIFAVTWASLLLKFRITFLIIFTSAIYWLGTPITWHILYASNQYPPPIGVFTCIFPFEGVMLVLLCFLLPRVVRNQTDNRKKIVAAYSSLIAPYLSFVSGLVYFRLFQYSTTNVGRILLPPAYTVVMKCIQLGLDIICVRCAHSASNLLIIIGRVIASYYSFAVLSYVRNPVAIVSIVFSKLGLHLFMSIFMVFPKVEQKITAWLPRGLLGWKSKFEKGVMEDHENDGATQVVIRNEFDKMMFESDAQYCRLHSDATNLWFSMFSDLLAIVMISTLYTMGRFGPTNYHYNLMFPFGPLGDDTSSKNFNTFLSYLGICFGCLCVAYFGIWVVLHLIIKKLEMRKVMHLVSVNWYPINHFYVMCINCMMAYVIVVVALMPDLFYIPGLDLWS